MNALERSHSIIQDILVNHLPRIQEGLEQGYVDENQILILYDHAVRARILREHHQEAPEPEGEPVAIGELLQTLLEPARRQLQPPRVEPGQLGERIRFADLPYGARFWYFNTPENDHLPPLLECRKLTDLGDGANAIWLPHGHWMKFGPDVVMEWTGPHEAGELCRNGACRS